jgi:murein DD-endopeptidase MepM/ murein hydrolase activator NlpD
MLRDKDMFIRHYGGRKKSFLSKVGTVIFVLSLVLVNYWVFLKDNLTISAPSLEQTVQPPPGIEIPAPEPASADVPVDLPDEQPATTVAGELKRGETMLMALQKLGVDTTEALPVINAMEDVMDFRSARAGDTFKIELDRVGQVVEFEFKQSPTEIYVVTREDGKYAAARKEVPTEVRIASIGCSIQGSLYKSFQRCGGDSRLANLFMNLFAWDFNFFEQAREGDTIRMLIEKVYVDNKFMHYGKILAAEYDGQVVGKFSVFHFQDPDGIEGYYSLEGQALRKEFLKVPVDYASAAQTNQRKSYEPDRTRHKKDLAVRYPGPSKASVWSVASGTVTFAGEVKGEGWVVEIQHSGGYKSRYAHLSNLAKGVTEGAQVFQKSNIGHLGEKRGKRDPYLLFTLKKGRHSVDHMKENFPGGEPVPGKYMDLFVKTVSKYIDELRTLDVMGLEDSQA